jgi:hypothetical protein
LGEQFLRNQAASFQHRSAAEYDRMKVPTLLTEMRPEALSKEYDCVAVEAQPAPGAALLLRRSGEQIIVIDGNRTVGVVDHEDVHLREAVDIGDGLLRAEVRSVATIGNFFTVVVAEPES